MTHNPTPWIYMEDHFGIYDSPDERGAQVRIADIVRTPSYKDNAEFIVVACNNHKRLVEALKRLRECQPSEAPIWDFREWDAAISEADDALAALAQSSPTDRQE